MPPHPTSFTAPRWTAATALGAALLLGGCASTYRVDSQVESFARWSDAGTASGTTATAPAALPRAPQTYRFERPLSQREGGAATRQNALEALAREVLTPLGMTRTTFRNPYPARPFQRSSSARVRPALAMANW